MIKRQSQRESVYQMYKQSHQKNVIANGLMILHRINHLSNLRQSRKNKLSKTMILNHNLLLRKNRNQLKKNRQNSKLKSNLKILNILKSSMLRNLPDLKPWKQSKINSSVLGKKNLILTSTVPFQNVVHRRVDSKANSQNISSGITRGSLFCTINSLSMYSAAILRAVSSVRVNKKKHLVSEPYS